VYAALNTIAGVIAVLLLILGTLGEDGKTIGCGLLILLIMLLVWSQIGPDVDW
jgi:hypothetical protein